MVQIAMLITGIVSGLACRSWRQAKVITLVVFAVVLAVQTPLVAPVGAFKTGVDIAVYSLIQAVSLAVALGMTRLLVRRRQRREVTA